MSLVWEPNPDRKRERGRVLPFVFQVRSEEISATKDTQEREAAPANQEAADAVSSAKSGKILRMRY